MMRTFLISTAVFAAVLCGALHISVGQSGATSVIKAATPIESGSFCGCLSKPDITTHVMPADIALPTQQDANCFAWQEFIALNWKAWPGHPGQPDPNAPPSQFGDPSSEAPVVWETYEPAAAAFPPSGKGPEKWGRTSAQVKSLSMVSKTGDRRLDLTDYQLAGTNGAWLTAQNKHLTLFEVRLNEDEYDYITKNKLYIPSVQQQYALDPGINLPDGTEPFWTYGKIGSVEIKAAWIELTDPSLYPYYKTSVAWVKYPGDSQARKVVVGLVGLHIIHKTKLGQQFIWATFEHVNNAPSIGDISGSNLKSWYMYYNPSCSSTDCPWNVMPTPGTSPMDAPIQTVRLINIDDSDTDNIVAINQAMWQSISQANPKSVFLNYQLVNVLWATNNTTIPKAAEVPLTQGSPEPNPQVEQVANTTMETYFQRQLTCLDCHASAPIASGPSSAALVVYNSRDKSGGHPQLASDYSFLFQTAKGN